MKNYEIKKQIQGQESDEKVAHLLSRLYNRLETKQIYAASLSASVELFLSLKYNGYEPKLILGTVGVDKYSFPHAWVELNEKIYDLSIYLDSKNHPVLKDKIEVIQPQIGKTYFDSNIDYFAFQFNETWEVADMKKMVGKNMKEYCDNNPTSNMWSDLCYILDLSPIPEKIKVLQDLAEKEYIEDFEE